MPSTALDRINERKKWKGISDFSDKGVAAGKKGIIFRECSHIIYKRQGDEGIVEEVIYNTMIPQTRGIVFEFSPWG